MKSFDLEFLRGNINIHNIEAKNFLNISRNDIALGKEKLVGQHIFEVAKDIFENQILPDKRTIEEVINGNIPLEDIVAFLYYTSKDQSLDAKLLPYIQYIDIVIGYDSRMSKSLLIKEILAEQKIIILRKNGEYICKGLETDQEYVRLIFKLLDDNCSVSINYTDESTEYVIDKNEINYSNYFDYQKNETNINMFYRACCPCTIEYKCLRIKYNIEPPHTFNHILVFPVDYMLLPVILERKSGERKLKDLRNELFFDWVMENKADKKVTREQVIADYERLYNECQEVFLKIKDKHKESE